MRQKNGNELGDGQTLLAARPARFVSAPNRKDAYND